MAPPRSQQFGFQMGAPSSDGKRWASYPNGDKYMLSSGGVIVSADGTLTDSAGNPLAANAQNIISVGGTIPNGSAGAIISGGRLLVSGSGFGVKPVALPLVYDDFRNGTVGNIVAGNAPMMRAIGGSFNWADFTAGSNRPRYSTTRLMGSKARSCLHNFTSGSFAQSLQIIHTMLNAGDEVYFTWWEYRDRQTVASSRNTKPFYIYGNIGGSTPSMLSGFGEVGGAENDPGFRTTAQESNLTPNSLFNYTQNQVTIEAEWIRWEFFIRQSDISVANGAAIYHLQTPEQGIPITQMVSSEAFCTRSISGYFRQFMLVDYYDQHNLAGDTAGIHVYSTDMYFDNTRARVELGDFSTWATCRKRFIQPTDVSWSDSYIDSQYNPGDFSAGSTAYAYVVLSNGTIANPTSGYPVTIQ